MITIVLALFLTVVLHELGHVVCIMIFNVTEGRRINDFSIHITYKYIFVSHIKFEKSYKNLIVALAGAVFPLLLAFLLASMFTHQFISILLLLTILNLMFLHPIFPDGKNVLSCIKEMER